MSILQLLDRYYSLKNAKQFNQKTKYFKEQLTKMLIVLLKII